MERHEAVAILKEIIHDHLGMPSIVLLERNKRGKFDLLFKAECNTPELKQFVAERNLALKEHELKGFCAIFKP